MASLTSAEFENLLGVLREIGGGLRDPRPGAVAGEVPEHLVASHLAYLAMRELMGRQDGTGGKPPPSVIFDATRAVTASSTLSTVTVTVPGPLPGETANLAAFPADGSSPEFVAANTAVANDGSWEFDLAQIANAQPIVRLELQRADGYPIRLGPRLDPV